MPGKRFPAVVGRGSFPPPPVVDTVLEVTLPTPTAESWVEGGGGGGGGQLPHGWVQSVDPSLRFQNGLSIVSVKIQCGVNHRLVSVRVRLRTDQGVVESYANLFEERVGKIVDQKDAGGGSCGESCTVRFLEFQFQFEFALTQIDEFRLRIDLKIHGSDTGGEWMDGHLETTGDAEIGRWYLEQIQHGIDDGFGTRDDGGLAHDDCFYSLRSSRR